MADDDRRIYIEKSKEYLSVSEVKERLNDGWLEKTDQARAILLTDQRDLSDLVSFEAVESTRRNPRWQATKNRLTSLEAILQILYSWAWVIVVGSLLMTSGVVCIAVCLVEIIFLIQNGVQGLEGHGISLSTLPLPPLLLHKTPIIQEMGGSCSKVMAAVISVLTILLTLTLLVINRTFTRNTETVTTLRWCHEKYHEIREKFDKTIGEYGAGECSLEKVRSAYHELVGLFYNEAQYFVRGLISLDVFCVWVGSWTKTYLGAKQDPNVIRVFIQAIHAIEDRDFTLFMNDIIVSDCLKSDRAIDIEKAKSNDAVGFIFELGSAPADLKETLKFKPLPSLLSRYRRQWQQKCYGSLAAFIGIIDPDHTVDGKIWTLKNRALFGYAPAVCSIVVAHYMQIPLATGFWGVIHHFIGAFVVGCSCWFVLYAIFLIWQRSARGWPMPGGDPSSKK